MAPTSSSEHRAAALPAIVLGIITAVALVCAAFAPSTAHAAGWNAEPTARQLERLSRSEPYVRYFASLRYGRHGAQIPAEYIRALILTESGANAAAVSGAGALGLTQIMPRTAAAVVREILAEGTNYLFFDEEGLESFEPEDLFDPALNILIACRLSSEYFLRWDGSTDHVVAAWNAGPTAVRRHGNRPPPYRETLDLISRVKSYMDFLENSYALAY